MLTSRLSLCKSAVLAGDPLKKDCMQSDLQEKYNAQVALVALGVLVNYLAFKYLPNFNYC